MSGQNCNAYGIQSFQILSRVSDNSKFNCYLFSAGILFLCTRCGRLRREWIVPLYSFGQNNAENVRGCIFLMVILFNAVSILADLFG